MKGLTLLFGFVLFLGTPDPLLLADKKFFVSLHNLITALLMENVFPSPYQQPALQRLPISSSP